MSGSGGAPGRGSGGSGRRSRSLDFDFGSDDVLCFYHDFAAASSERKRPDRCRRSRSLGFEFGGDDVLCFYHDFVAASSEPKRPDRCSQSRSLGFDFGGDDVFCSYNDFAAACSESKRPDPADRNYPPYQQPWQQQSSQPVPAPLTQPHQTYLQPQLTNVQQFHLHPAEQTLSSPQQYPPPPVQPQESSYQLPPQAMNSGALNVAHLLEPLEADDSWSHAFGDINLFYSADTTKVAARSKDDHDEQDLNPTQLKMTREEDLFDVDVFALGHQEPDDHDWLDYDYDLEDQWNKDEWNEDDCGYWDNFSLDHYDPEDDWDSMDENEHRGTVVETFGNSLDLWPSDHGDDWSPEVSTYQDAHQIRLIVEEDFLNDDIFGMDLLGNHDEEEEYWNPMQFNDDIFDMDYQDQEDFLTEDDGENLDAFGLDYDEWNEDDPEDDWGEDDPEDEWIPMCPLASESAHLEMPLAEIRDRGHYKRGGQKRLPCRCIAWIV